MTCVGTLKQDTPYLGICPQVAHALHVDHDHVVARPLKCEVAEGLGREATRLVDKTRVGVVLDVVPLNKVLQVVERLARSVVELNHTHLEYVHLWAQKGQFTQRPLTIT